MLQSIRNKRLIIGLILLLAIGAVWTYQNYRAGVETEDLSLLKKLSVEDETFGIGFSYPSEAEGFTLVEPPSDQEGVLKSYLLIPTADYEDFVDPTEARETPASISVLIFALDTSATTTGTSSPRESRITRLQNWAMDNSTITSYNESKATPDIVELDGLTALHYKTDGLYQQDMYLAAYKGKVFMLVGAYNAETDLTYVAFQEFIKTVSFK